PACSPRGYSCRPPDRPGRARATVPWRPARRRRPRPAPRRRGSRSAPGRAPGHGGSAPAPPPRGRSPPDRPALGHAKEAPSRSPTSLTCRALLLALSVAAPFQLVAAPPAPDNTEVGAMPTSLLTGG